jgi:hypothetical protein
MTDYGQRIHSYPLPPLHLAASLWNFDFVEKLCGLGARIDQADQKGLSILHHLIGSVKSHGNFFSFVPEPDKACELMKFFLDKGADPNQRDDANNTPLHLLFGWHQTNDRKLLTATALIDLLMNYGARLSAYNDKLETPIVYIKKDLLKKEPYLRKRFKKMNWETISQSVIPPFDRDELRSTTHFIEHNLRDRLYDYNKKLFSSKDPAGYDFSFPMQGRRHHNLRIDLKTFKGWYNRMIDTSLPLIQCFPRKSRAIMDLFLECISFEESRDLRKILGAKEISTHLKSKTLFDAETGAITADFKKQLDLVNITIHERALPSLDPYHVHNVCNFLENHGFKKGDDFDLKIDFNQAKRFLDYTYGLRVEEMPRKKCPASAIFPCSEGEQIMRKRFHSFQRSLDQGFMYDSVHFITKNVQTKEAVERLIHKKYRDVIGGIEAQFVIANPKHGLSFFQNGLKTLSTSSLLGKEYVIITDPPFARVVEAIAVRILPTRTCLGVAKAPIADWREDIKAYGYEEALGSFEKATIAWASVIWRDITQQARREGYFHASSLCSEDEERLGYAPGNMYPIIY